MLHLLGLRSCSVWTSRPSVVAHSIRGGAVVAARCASGGTPSLAEMVKELRVRTGAPMLECKKALEQSQGDLDAAVEELRKRGVAMAGKKSVRTTSEGLVALRSVQEGRGALIVEVNSETDFVAKNPDFVAFTAQVADTMASRNCSVEQVEGEILQGSSVSVSVAKTDLIAKLGENIQVRRASILTLSPQWSNSSAVIATYIHGVAGEGMGKSACAVALECKAAGQEEGLQDIGHKIAMHITAMKPRFLDRNSVPAEVLEKERDILKEQARMSGKPEHIIEKMTEGRLNTFFKEECLLEQEFVLSEKKGESVAQHLKELAKTLGGDIVVREFLKLERGEGIEKNKMDFADEVAAAASSK